MRRTKKDTIYAIALFAFIAAAGASLLPAAQTHPQRKVQIAGPQFTVDGHSLQIISGEMHYPRIPREYWRDRMKKARAMGLNTISTYVFWNLHEPQRGKYDFTGQNDIAAFIRIAQEEGLYVLLRPGPYVCSEWDLGGLPAWLLASPDIVLRSTDAQFMRPAEEYLKRLGQELVPYLATRGGPIIGVQVENEYGSFGKDAAYMQKVRDAIVAAGFGEVPLFTADGPEQLPFGTLADVPAAVNFGPGSAQRAFATLAQFRPQGLRMNQEYWAGWFDQWGKPHHKTNFEREASELDWMLSQGYSVNLYMFHGGTTFGFMNGANWDGGYRPQTTSYDYNSALDESGVPTAKFTVFRDVIAKRRAGEQFPPVPEEPPQIEIQEFALTESAWLWSNLGLPAESQTIKPMESFGQSYGYILYSTTIHGPAAQELALKELRDYAEVFIDAKPAGTMDRRLNQDHLMLDIPAGDHLLGILVENSGRINFGAKLRDDRKGITQSVSLGGRELKGWQIFCLPMNNLSSVRFSKGLLDGPSFYRGYFELSQTGDTFLNTRNLGKGVIWVNGHSLGRFWNIGPQQTLYLPGAWLKIGHNEIILFDLVAHSTSPKIAGLAHPILDQLNEPVAATIGGPVSKFGATNPQ
ncbi:MAG: beta-galactosidase [Candidatus Acidiferrales bacterium]